MKTNCLVMAIIWSGLIFCSTSVFSQNVSNYSGVSHPKIEKSESQIKYDPNQYPPPSREGGENVNNAVLISSLPFNDFGNTCGHLHDYNGCWSTTAPDLVYYYIPSVDEWISVSLCGSDFDTQLFASKNDINNIIAKSDDDCWDASSVLACFDVHPGNIYYILVTGWSGECGDYVINVSSCGTISVLECPPCAIPEGEADIAETCHTQGVDVTNGGCGTNPPLFTDINIGDIYYGRCNIYDNGGFWDTDHYRIILTETKTLYWSAYSNFNMEINIIRGGCPGASILKWGYGNKSFVSVSADLAPGTYQFRVKPAELMFGENEGEYVATLTEEPVSPNPADWCPLPPPVPVSNWAIIIGIIMTVAFISYKFWIKK